MRIGKLRHQIALQSVVGTQDGYGDPAEAWTTYATVWASINPIKGEEIVSAEQQQGEVTHKIMIRFLSTVTVLHRVVFKSRNFEINFVRNINEQDCYMELICREVA